MIWLVGYQLKGGQYIIEKALKPGGFGMTYIARDKNRRRVVIKTLNDTVQQHPNFTKFQQDFLNEALRIAQCTHAHIVKIYELFLEGSLPCMALEYIDGEDLATRVFNRGILPESEALRYIQQIGEALIVVHDRGLLHRDIKPDNIMLRADGSGAVLIDFGIAREFNPNITQSHTQFLTDRYAPIEQYDRHARRGAYTDIYALAAALFVLLTGYEVDPDSGYLVPRFPPAPARAAGRPLPEPKRLRSISDRVNYAIIKGMAFQPHERPQTMQEWLELLGVRNVAVNPPQPPIPQPAIPPPRPQPPIPQPVNPPPRPQPPIPQPVNPAPRPQLQSKSIPWGWLIVEFFIHAITGGSLALVFAPPVAVVITVAWVVTWAWLLSIDPEGDSSVSVREWSFSVIWLFSGALAIAFVSPNISAWSMAVLSAFSGVGSGSYTGKELAKYYNKFQTFIILGVTSCLGMAVGWFGILIFYIKIHSF